MLIPTVNHGTTGHFYDCVTQTHRHTHTHTPVHIQSHLTPYLIKLSHHNLVQAFFSSDEDMAHYICDQCGKSFTLGTNLSRHKQVHVNGKFSCNNCFLKFSSQLSLDQHRRTVHGVAENPSGFCCETCGKSYKQKKHMLRHQQSHTKQDHKCNTCNSTFKTERNLTDISR